MLPALAPKMGSGSATTILLLAPISGARANSSASCVQYVCVIQHELRRGIWFPACWSLATGHSWPALPGNLINCAPISGGLQMIPLTIRELSRQFISFFVRRFLFIMFSVVVAVYVGLQGNACSPWAEMPIDPCRRR